MDIFGFFTFLMISTVLFAFFVRFIIKNSGMRYFIPLCVTFTVLIFSNYAYYKVSIYYPNYYRLKLRNNQCKILVGRVKNFRQNIQGKSTLEDFFVNKIKFIISEDDGQVGFKQTTHNGGPIRENLLVQICYIDNFPHNLILELKVDH